jgi:hypothetical protein
MHSELFFVEKAAVPTTPQLLSNEKQCAASSTCLSTSMMRSVHSNCTKFTQITSINNWHRGGLHSLGHLYGVLSLQKHNASKAWWRKYTEGNSTITNPTKALVYWSHHSCTWMHLSTYIARCFIAHTRECWNSRPDTIKECCQIPCTLVKAFHTLPPVSGTCGHQISSLGTHPCEKNPEL